MILILSSEKDLSTSNVIEWLIYFDEKFGRINGEDLINIKIEISNLYSDIIIKFIDKEISLKNCI